MITDSEVDDVLRIITSIPNVSKDVDSFSAKIVKSRLDRFVMGCLYHLAGTIDLIQGLEEGNPSESFSYTQARTKIREAMMWIDDAKKLRQSYHQSQRLADES